MKPNGFPKEEKLKQKKEISLLFEKGKWKTCGNVRIISLKNEGAPNQKFGVSVSKRLFKKAVDRNRIKRLLREAYRLNKDPFNERFGTGTVSMIFWISKDMPAHYRDVEAEFINLCKSKK